MAVRLHTNESQHEQIPSELARGNLSPQIAAPARILRIHTPSVTELFLFATNPLSDCYPLRATIRVSLFVFNPEGNNDVSTAFTPPRVSLGAARGTGASR
ncbi:N-acetyl-gamma-glutamyl-phosphate reductase [Schaalia cardiffensis F0333]|uniref:N-acetyl-gamma-glutamyl-phosphate reductase n=1 Tax=Schaalia cardiffensis F0333 TaxID=888050 RepID=N6WE30_9ACTO|nr:N-acetyl-gamma-glutamyl-phosphate reductase [Schaalia cardiffensis F0333]